MQTWFVSQSQFLLLTGGCLLGFGAQFFWSRGKPGAAQRWLVAVVAIAVLALGGRSSEQSAAHERRQIQTVTEGFARLYAHEMEERGHSRLASDAGPDDPHYLSLIEAEKGWLAINAAVNDIYTLRKRPDGANAFLVDSETDYNRNGQFDEEREQRTAIGEVFEGDAGLEAAFRGQANFEFEPVTDRWGTWLSAYAPLHDSEGRVEGVLGVDFDAAEFSKRIAAAKMRVLGLVAFAEAVLLAASLFVGVMHSRVAERQRSGRALRESEGRFANAFEYAAIGMALVAPDGKWLKVNRALCKLVGYESAELLAITFQEITHPDDLAADLDHVRRLLAGESETYQMEKRYFHKCGHEVLVLLSVSLVQDGEGRPLHFISQIQDVTKRKQGEALLMESEQRLGLATKSAGMGIWDWDVVADKLAWDEQMYKLYGVCPKDFGGAYDAWHKGLHPEDRERGDAAIHAALDGAREFQVEFRVLWPTGEVRHIEANGLVQRAEDGSAIRMIGVNRDITERKLGEAELEKAHRALLETSRQAGMAEVATSVLHNVGNVLNSVNVSATIVSDTIKKSERASLTKVVTLLREHEADLGTFLGSDGKGKQVVGFLDTLAKHLATEQTATVEELKILQKNIEHIKDVVAMQQSYAKVSGVNETLSVVDLIEDTLQMNAESLAKHDVEVVRDFADVPDVTVDKHKLLQILVNLVRNAKHSCDEAGRAEKRVTLRVANGNGRVKISVSDNGMGIPPENLTRIFNHGFTTKKEGHGFGLHSGALAAREMGGTLLVQSEGAGLGATFTIELPLQAPGQNPAPAIHESASAA